MGALTTTQEILSLTLEHLSMVLIATGIAGVTGIALGIALTRRPNWRRGVVGFASVMQTVPSLALFGFLIPLPLIGGIGRRTAIIFVKQLNRYVASCGPGLASG